MKRSRFPQEQIIGVLREHQAGLGTAEVCRKNGISPARAFYQWHSRYSGLEASATRRLRNLEEENTRLKNLLAEQMLDVTTLKEM